MSKEDTKPNKQRRRRKRRGFLYAPFAFLFAILAIFFGLSAFFHITDVKVTGNMIYSSQQVIDASGIGVGDNLFLVQEAKAATKIFNSLPYIKEVKIERVFPGTITIAVTESYPLAYIQSDTNYWLIDKDGKLLEKTNAAGIAGKINVKGVDLNEPAAGSFIKTVQSNATQLQYLTAILNAMLNQGIAVNVSYLDVSNISNITFDYTNRFTVKFGSGENADNKVNLLLSVLTRLKSNDKGTINLSVDKKADFSPE